MTSQKTFADGTPYIEAGGWRLFFSWLVDFVVYLLGVAFGFVVFAGVGTAVAVSESVVVIGTLALFIVVPLLYGLLLVRARSLGAVVTGTRLVRTRDGGRVGAKGPWAMLVRTLLLPLLLIALIVGGGYADGTLKRVSIDPVRTRRVREQYGIAPL
ncbi:hypothetical protein [Glycomyces paridis]|uniref:RDD family protein n=1 Tax=Glycomyces paridis TaxID=2126555 RepID=A0A4S8PHD5_9ACTN|nr:hypothetical protein [Glycomyces paridis]THV30000.1 hypothetical protein E9998_06345 [Glycomyces paridis]